MEILYKYEFSRQIVDYLLSAVNNQQIRGIQAAKDLIIITELLQSPVNKEDIEKKNLEELKAKYEPKIKDEKK